MLRSFGRGWAKLQSRLGRPLSNPRTLAGLYLKMEQDLKDYDLKSGIESELLSRYRIGGFHPVSIGDSLCDGRYHISFKLGFGSFSTDWLALDTHHNRLVNIKILLADFGEQSHEETVLRALSQSDKQHPGRQHVSTLLDTFSHTGRNGVHRCLVFKVMNLTLGQQCQRDARLRAEAAWSVSKQVAQALQYIHSQGFIHGDVHSGNVMLASHPKGLSELSLLDSLPTLQETPYSSSGIFTTTHPPFQFHHSSYDNLGDASFDHKLIACRSHHEPESAVSRCGEH